MRHLHEVCTTADSFRQNFRYPGHDTLAGSDEAIFQVQGRPSETAALRQWLWRETCIRGDRELREPELGAMTRSSLFFYWSLALGITTIVLAGGLLN
jgi:hypothetical protein